MNRQTFFILLLFIIFFDLPRSGQDNSLDKEGHVLSTYKASLKDARTELLHGEYHTGYGNLTGLKLSYEDALQNRNVSSWPFRKYSEDSPWQEQQSDSLLPDMVSSKIKSTWARDPVEEDSNAYMLNITGDIYGDFSIARPSDPLKPIPMDLPPYLSEFFNAYRHEKYEEEKQRYEDDPENNPPPTEIADSIDKTGNITEYDRGQIGLRIYPLETTLADVNIQKHGLGLYKDAVIVYMDVELRDKAKADTNEFVMFGIYFQNTGSLVGISRSAKFMGNHALPHFTMNPENFNKTKVLMDRLLSVQDIDKDYTLEDVTKSLELAHGSCELVTYLQFKKTQYTKKELMFIDDELKLRQGQPLPKKIPELEIEHAILYSPDCGLVFEKVPEIPMVGKRREVKLTQFRHVLMVVFFLSLIELNLFMRQAKLSRAPSSLSNISNVCIGLLSGYDSIVAMIMISVMWVTELYLICACNTILNILLFYVFEVRFLTSIGASQANERGTSWWEILRGSSAPQEPSVPVDLEAQSTGTQAPTNNEPAAAEAAAPATPAPEFGTNPNQVMSFFAMSSILSFAVTLLILNATSWRFDVLNVFEHIFLLLLNSYWIPQFLRNTLKNRSRTLSWEFIIGTSLVRLVPLIYLCLDKSNPFRHPYNPGLVIAVASWQAIQIFLLYLQGRLGARFWLNSKWLPEQYNYHPVLTIKALESGFSKDILAGLDSSTEQEAVMHQTDCPICMSPLAIPILLNEAANPKPYEALMRNIMVTPCHHIFDAQCLEGWMAHKLQCPVCRSSLPPL